VGVRKHGVGLQYEIRWSGRAETTWDAASRVRRQYPMLVQAFELLQQQQQPQRRQQEGEGRIVEEGGKIKSPFPLQKAHRA
jgi:hypothetical protein